MSETPGGSRRDTTVIVIGGLLVLAGFWFLAGQRIAPWWAPVADAVARVKQLGWPIVLVLVGVALILFARSPGFKTPQAGSRLYRSRTKKMVSGVFGGLSDYFGVDVTVLRVAFVALALLLDAGPAIIAYIIASIIVPKEPDVAAVPPAPIEWPTPPAPPAPPELPPPPPPA
ncbi:MAG: hypothetical protein C0418_06155 [Coriobacteriaceae bacterium]|nr:hypothetical protein [Coriobacteriaceae bacterium]